MKTNIIDIIVYLLFVLSFCFAAFFIYPKPAEIIFLAFGGFVIFFILGSIFKKWVKTLNTNLTKKQEILKFVYQVIIVTYALGFLLVLRTSWWEGRIIFNITQTAIGKAYLAILFTVLILFLVFYFKHHRWPKKEDLGITEKSKK